MSEFILSCLVTKDEMITSLISKNTSNTKTEFGAFYIFE